MDRLPLERYGYVGLVSLNRGFFSEDNDLQLIVSIQAVNRTTSGEIENEYRE